MAQKLHETNTAETLALGFHVLGLLTYLNFGIFAALAFILLDPFTPFGVTIRILYYLCAALVFQSFFGSIWHGLSIIEHSRAMRKNNAHEGDALSE